MLYLIPGIIITILSVTGFVVILKSLVFRIFKDTSKNSELLIIPQQSELSNPEYRLRGVGENIKWKGYQRPEKVICISDKMTIEGKEIASLICNDYNFMEIMTTKEFFIALEKKIRENDC